MSLILRRKFDLKTNKSDETIKNVETKAEDKCKRMNNHKEAYYPQLQLNGFRNPSFGLCLLPFPFPDLNIWVKMRSRQGKVQAEDKERQSASHLLKVCDIHQERGRTV